METVGPIDVEFEVIVVSVLHMLGVITVERSMCKVGDVGVGLQGLAGCRGRVIGRCIC